MMNILVPLGGKSTFFNDGEFKFPKVLIEIDGKPMIELVVNNIKLKGESVRFVFVINKEDQERYHLDSVLSLITDGECEVVVLQGSTKGACCSALMAIEYINNADELLICNGDQLINEDLNGIINEFRAEDADAGVICFEAVHPRLAFARIENGEVIETAEKHPISKNALAGYYYYKKGSDFVEAAMLSIEKDANVNGLFYIAPVLNEMILKNKNIKHRMINSDQFYTFNVPEKVKGYRRYKDEFMEGQK